MEHHAQLLVGSKEWGIAQIPSEYASGSPDITHLEFNRMGIDDARTLIREASRTPVFLPQRIFIVYAESILVEAQNALLKLFEEPNMRSRFYILIAHSDTLLPTLMSRLHVFGYEQQNGQTQAFNEFLHSSYPERLNLIAKKIKDEDTAWVNACVIGLEHYAQTKKDPSLIKDTLLLLSYMQLPGSSKKMLLEHIALTL